MKVPCDTYYDTLLRSEASLCHYICSRSFLFSQCNRQWFVLQLFIYILHVVSLTLCCRPGSHVSESRVMLAVRMEDKFLPLPYISELEQSYTEVGIVFVMQQIYRKTYDKISIRFVAIETLAIRFQPLLNFLYGTLSVIIYVQLVKNFLRLLLRKCRFRHFFVFVFCYQITFSYKRNKTQLEVNKR